MTTAHRQASTKSGVQEAVFCDATNPLDVRSAHVAADRCYFCFDAPCMQACPTHIDVPMFIRQIATGNPLGAAQTIFSANIFGGMCARVCPVESLCEQDCVRNHPGDTPVAIGRLQRFATDMRMEDDAHPFVRAQETGKRIAIVGSGPAGLACAHALARYGHSVVVFDAKAKAGGLNEYGLAAYKTVDDFAAREIDFILRIGGIVLETDRTLGSDLSIDNLLQSFDAVFLGLGLQKNNMLGIAGETLGNIYDATDFIARIRQAKNHADIPVGHHVVVIGGGMTAVDIAVQMKLLGAAHVSIVCRGAAMRASQYEQVRAKKHDVHIYHDTVPITFHGTTNVTAISCKHGPETIRLSADQVFKAVGQRFAQNALADANIALINDRIAVDAAGKTSRAHVWAGGDCIDGNSGLTVAAVANGKTAAESIHTFLATAVSQTK